MEVFERINRKEFTYDEELLLKNIYKNRLLDLAALKEMETRADILREDFRQKGCYNPIEHIKTRIKKPESILKKVYLRNIPMDASIVRESLNDIAGIRIVCTFKEDIYRISKIIQDYEDVEILQIKDYIQNPKPSGYQSYHIIAKIPVHLADGKQYVKIEIQLRTMAMDFWASLEHKIKYKFDWELPENIRQELKTCANIVDSLDNNMQDLHKKVHKELKKK